MKFNSGHPLKAVHHDGLVTKH